MSSKLPSSDLEALPTNPNQGERLPISRYALFFLPCILGVTADLGTKAYMFGNYFEPAKSDSSSFDYAPQFAHWWIEGIFGIQTSTNPGALFGLGSGYSWLFAIFSVVALVGIVTWLFVYRAMRDRWLTFALGMISGGILGNLYDRVGLGSLPDYPAEIHTNVRDWILFRLEGVMFFDPWPNFNIADVCLVCGAVMLFIHAIFYSESGQSGESADSESQPTVAS